MGCSVDRYSPPGCASSTVAVLGPPDSLCRCKSDSHSGNRSPGTFPVSQRLSLPLHPQCADCANSHCAGVAVKLLTSLWPWGVADVVWIDEPVWTDE